MQASNFDELTKALASTTSRRQALKTIATASIGSLLGLGGIRTAFGKNKNCAHFCAAVFGANTPAANQCTNDAAHGSGLCFRCGSADPSQICCVRNTMGYCSSYTGAQCPCNSAQCQTCDSIEGACVGCPSGQTCCSGTCAGCCSNSDCSTGQVCHNGSCCEPCGPPCGCCASITSNFVCSSNNDCCEGLTCCASGVFISSCKIAAGGTCSSSAECCSNQCCAGRCC